MTKITRSIIVERQTSELELLVELITTMYSTKQH